VSSLSPRVGSSNTVVAFLSLLPGLGVFWAVGGVILLTGVATVSRGVVIPWEAAVWFSCWRGFSFRSAVLVCGGGGLGLGVRVSTLVSAWRIGGAISSSEVAPADTVGGYHCMVCDELFSLGVYVELLPVVIVEIVLMMETLLSVSPDSTLEVLGSSGRGVLLLGVLRVVNSSDDVDVFLSVSVLVPDR
jgi:hypothetical protein